MPHPLGERARVAPRRNRCHHTPVAAARARCSAAKPKRAALFSFAARSAGALSPDPSLAVTVCCARRSAARHGAAGTRGGGRRRVLLPAPIAPAPPPRLRRWLLPPPSPPPRVPFAPRSCGGRGGDHRRGAGTCSIHRTSSCCRTGCLAHHVFAAMPGWRQPCARSISTAFLIAAAEEILVMSFRRDK